MATFSSLSGQTIVEVSINDTKTILEFTTLTKKYRMYHEPDCCESVYIEDICGELEDLKATVLEAEEVSESKTLEYGDTCTFTFYKIQTTKGSVTIRWYGESNGYYSEAVSFKEIK